MRNKVLTQGSRLSDKTISLAQVDCAVGVRSQGGKSSAASALPSFFVVVCLPPFPKPAAPSFQSSAGLMHLAWSAIANREVRHDGLGCV